MHVYRSPDYDRIDKVIINHLSEIHRKSSIDHLNEGSAIKEDRRNCQRATKERTKIWDDIGNSGGYSDQDRIADSNDLQSNGRQYAHSDYLKDHSTQIGADRLIDPPYNDDRKLKKAV